MFRGRGVWAATVANRTPVIRRERNGEDSNSILGNSTGSFPCPCRMTRNSDAVYLGDKAQTVHVDFYDYRACGRKVATPISGPRLRNNFRIARHPLTGEDSGKAVSCSSSCGGTRLKTQGRSQTRTCARFPEATRANRPNGYIDAPGVGGSCCRTAPYLCHKP